MTKDLKVGEIIGEAWEGARLNWPMFLLLVVIYVAVQVAVNVGQKLGGPGSLAGDLGGLLGALINIVLQFLLLKLSLKVVASPGAKVELFSEMEVEGAELLRFMLTAILVAAILLLAVVACFIPFGVLALLSLGLAVFTKAGLAKMVAPLLISLFVAFLALVAVGLMVSQSMLVCLHQGLGPWASVKESVRLTEGAKGALLLLALGYMVLIVAGIICLLVGLIPAMMVIFLAQAEAYLSLLKQSGPAPV